MTKKRQSGSSVISVMEDESLDLENINEERLLVNTMMILIT